MQPFQADWREMVFQITKNMLEAFVLAIVKQEDTYGYVLTQRVKEVTDISDSTLYPVLRRLQKDGALSTYDAAFQGRNRRYYSITPRGRMLLDAYREEWEQYKETVDKVFTGGLNHE